LLFRLVDDGVEDSLGGELFDKLGDLVLDSLEKLQAGCDR
jgi:hypothetical protein